MALNSCGHGNVIFACAAMLFCISDAKIGFHISSWFSKKAKFIFQCSKNFVGLLDQIEIFWFSGTNSLRIYHQKEMRLREYWERQKIQVQFCRRSRRKKIAPMILKMRKDSLRWTKGAGRGKGTSSQSIQSSNSALERFHSKGDSISLRLSEKHQTRNCNFNRKTDSLLFSVRSHNWWYFLSVSNIAVHLSQNLRAWQKGHKNGTKIVKIGSIVTLWHQVHLPHPSAVADHILTPLPSPSSLHCPHVTQSCSVYAFVNWICCICLHNMIRIIFAHFHVITCNIM